MIYLPFISLAMLIGASAFLFTARYPQWWKLYVFTLMGLCGFALFIYWFIKTLW